MGQMARRARVAHKEHGACKDGQVCKAPKARAVLWALLARLDHRVPLGLLAPMAILGRMAPRVPSVYKARRVLQAQPVQTVQTAHRYS